jgi:exodeoxyribonuclease V alpha subunit
VPARRTALLRSTIRYLIFEQTVGRALMISMTILPSLLRWGSAHNEENGFCVLRTRARGHRDLVAVVVQAAAVSSGEWITALGECVNYRTHGQSFRARFLKTPAPPPIEGIEKNLGSGMLRGIGPA